MLIMYGHLNQKLIFVVSMILHTKKIVRFNGVNHFDWSVVKKRPRDTTSQHKSEKA